MRDNHARDFDDPPNSRLFVAHTKQVSEEELRGAFGKYGTLDDVWMCRDKNTGEQKDIAFIKFAKTSEAARAMEALNGKHLDGHSRPLKVNVALSRDQPNSSARGDEMERLLRLFVVVPKSMTEKDVENEFEQFGELDYVSIIKDRETRESKGYAFVKFLKASAAATAFEECDRSFKAVFARPKEQDNQRKQHYSNSNNNDMYDRPNQSSPASFSAPFSAPFPERNVHPYNHNRSYGSMDLSGQEGTRLTAVVSAHLTQHQVERLFDLMPGFKYCRAVNESSSYNRDILLRRIIVEYNSPSAAKYALEKLHGFEYPLGKQIIVKPEYDQRGGESVLAGKRDAMGLATAPEITQELATLTKALAEATNMIKLQVGGALAGVRMNSSQMSETYDPSLCTVRLPPPQPLARSESKMEERLFILGHPALPPKSALWDVFGRFGDLIEVYIISGKNCGFVNYARKESADRALEALHGQDVCKMRLKVTYADPPKSDSRKRIKMDTDG